MSVNQKFETSFTDLMYELNGQLDTTSAICACDNDDYEELEYLFDKYKREQCNIHDSVHSLYNVYGREFVENQFNTRLGDVHRAELA